MTNSPQPAAELNTWQEIAAYLGISVREAQYREKNDGMPVHRMPGKKARVWDYRLELEDWKSRMVSSANVAEVPASAPPAPSGQFTEPSQGDEKVFPAPRISRRMLLGGLAGTAVVSAAGTGWFLRRHGPGVPVKAAVAGNSLLAWDEAGGLAWTHRFTEPPRDRSIGFLRPERELQIVDLRGDGNKQIILAAGFPQSDGGPDREELICFSSEGRLLWRYKPELSFTFGDTKFTGPWFFTDMVVVPGGPRRTIWLAAVHWRWRPSFILGIDSDGRADVKFVSAGHVYALSSATTPAGRYILAGGVNNEYASAAMAILREDAPPSCSPQTRGSRFECVDGPKGLPDRYFLFPPSDLTVASGKPYNRVHRIMGANGSYIVSTDELFDTQEAGVDYGFSKDLEPKDVSYGDGYGALHRRLESEGRLKHALAECTRLGEPVPVRRWDRTAGWTTVKVPRMAGVAPDAYRP